ERDRHATDGVRDSGAQHELAGRLRRGEDKRIGAYSRWQPGRRNLDDICKSVQASDGDGRSRRAARLERQFSRRYGNRKRAFRRKRLALSRRAGAKSDGGGEAAKN